MMSILINGLILALLIGTIAYIYLVDLRVRKLLSALNSLEPMVGQFSEAVDRSENSLEQLRTKTTEIVSNPDEDTSSEDEDNADSSITFQTSRRSLQKHVGRVKLPGKSELVRSFFETAKGQET